MTIPDEFIPTPSSTNDAFKELRDFLEEGESIEALCFGDFGWGGGWHGDGPPPVPKGSQGVLLSFKQAACMMRGWSFYGGYGAPMCYATHVWTNRRVIWVTQYDGATSLTSMPRNPEPCKPQMPGG